MPVDHTSIFKALDPGRRSPYQQYQWPEIGEWIEAPGNLIRCGNGLHVARGPQVLRWLRAELYEVQISGELLEADDKLVTSRARLVRRLPWGQREMVGFAVDCADRVLPIFEAKRPGDGRARAAVDAATVWVLNPSEENGRKARNAADASYTNAANDAAAYAAAAAAYAADAAAYGVYTNAGDVADAAYAADAAANAAADASYDAAYTAGDVADAAYAADAAAYRQERTWQFDRLCCWLNGEITLPVAP